jgi:hypothetical protein
MQISKNQLRNLLRNKQKESYLHFDKQKKKG